MCSGLKCLGLHLLQACFQLLSGLECAMPHATQVSFDPPIYISDDCVSESFLRYVEAGFRAKVPGRVVEKQHGRQILARSVDFPVPRLMRLMLKLFIILILLYK